MHTRILLITAIIILGMMSFTGNPELIVTSAAFINNGIIPVKYSCDGAETNPPLHVENLPSNTRSVAIIVHDPDAPVTGGFTHWVLWDAGTDGNIPEDYKGADQGLNGAGQKGYKGMCPPSGVHHYHFYVYALDTKLNIDNHTNKAGLEKAMNGHILAKGDLVGLYKKTK